jgi:NADH-quinone oxidoreductase subunit M
MSELGGLWKRLPLLAFFLILSSMGSAAVPGLNGFVGEFPILAGMFFRSPTSAVFAATGMILGAYYLFWMLERVLFGPLREPHAHGSENGSHGTVRPVGWHEIAGLTPLMVLIVLIGVYPRPFLDRIRPAVYRLEAPIVDKERIQYTPLPMSVGQNSAGEQTAPDSSLLIAKKGSR